MNHRSLNQPSFMGIAPNIDRFWAVTDFDAVRADPVVGAAEFTQPQIFTDTFNVTEETIAGYVQADFNGDLAGLSVRGNAGVRVVNTSQTSSGFVLIDGEPQPTSVDNDYTRVLPSFNAAVDLSEDLIFRLGASRSLTRPTLSQISPRESIAPTGLTVTRGNPNLDPFSATQIDTSLEWYFTDEALVAVTFFYKDVESFIVNVISEGVVPNAAGLINDDGFDVTDAIFQIREPVNGEGASVIGFEASYQQPFTFLPAPFDGFGLLANFTFADSESEIEFNGETINTLLPGQSRTSYNLIGYYEKGPFSTRLAYSWRDKFLSSVRGSNRRNDFTDSFGTLDANVQYAISDRLTLTIDAINLLGEEFRQFAETRDRVLTFQETGRFVLFGIRGKL